MRSRHGFVSNSSSSSFIIVNNTGAALPFSEFVRDTEVIVSSWYNDHRYLGEEFLGIRTYEELLAIVLEQASDMDDIDADPMGCCVRFTDDDPNHDIIGHIYRSALEHFSATKRFSWSLEYNSQAW